MKMMIAILCVLLPVAASAGDKLKFETSYGDVVVELYNEKTPVTVANILRYVDEGFYDGLIFHRVIQNFVVQGGGHAPDMSMKPTHEPIVHERAACGSNIRGSLGMARTSVPDSATSQFYVNLVDNIRLDYQSEAAVGYCAFAIVIEGMDIVDRMALAETGNKNGHQNVPVTPIVITKVSRQ